MFWSFILKIFLGKFILRFYSYKYKWVERISVIYLQRKLPKHNFPFLTLFQKDNAFFHENIKILTILSLFDLKFCVGLKMYRWSKFKNFAFNKIRFLIKFWKSTIFFYKIRKLFLGFCFTMYSKRNCSHLK